MATTLGLINFVQANYNFDLDGNPLPSEDPTQRTYGKEETGTLLPRHLARQAGSDRHGRSALVADSAGPRSEWITGQHHPSNWGLYRAPGGVGRGPVGPPAKRARSATWRPAARKGSRSGTRVYEFLAAHRRGLLAASTGRLFSQTVRRVPARPRSEPARDSSTTFSGWAWSRCSTATRSAFSSSLTQNTFQLTNAPRFSGLSDIPAAGLLPPPSGGPSTPPNSGAWSQGIDSSVQAPYSINPTVFVSRELGGGFIAEVGYVGRARTQAAHQRHCRGSVRQLQGSHVRRVPAGCAQGFGNAKSATAVRSPLSVRSRFGRTCIRMPPRRK